MAIIRLVEAMDVGSIALTRARIIIVEMNALIIARPRTSKLVCPGVAAKISRAVDVVRYRARLGMGGRVNRCRYLRASSSVAESDRGEPPGQRKI